MIIREMNAMRFARAEYVYADVLVCMQNGLAIEIHCAILRESRLLNLIIWHQNDLTWTNLGI